MRTETPYKVFLVGAGNRGRIYSDWILKHPGILKITAAADPVEERLDYIAVNHNLPNTSCFKDWKDLLNSGIKADGVIIATGDRDHTVPAAAFLERGVHVLLEKPMAVEREDLFTILTAAETARGKGGSLTVCHVLRYSPFFRKIKEIIDSGKLGDVQSISHSENISYYHYAHSYVRGNWRNSSESSPLILAKSSHDLDLLQWFAGSKPVWISSTSSRSIFTEKNAPAGVPERCSDGCPVSDRCLYEAEKTYLYGMPVKNALSRSSGILGKAASFMILCPRLSGKIPFLSRYSIWKEWPTSTITGDLSGEGIVSALKSGPYGRCVYRCDNDQPEHQETIVKFESGVTAVFRLHGMSHEEGRTLRIDGTLGTLRAKFGSGSELRLYLKGERKDIFFPVSSDFIGHSEADEALMDEWSRVFSGEKSASSAKESVFSHLMAFAADESAKTGKAVILEGQL